MVIQYLPIAMAGLAVLQGILLTCILVQVRRINKQQPKGKPEEMPETKSKKTATVSFSASAPILPWLRHASRDDMIDSFRVLAEAQQNERK